MHGICEIETTNPDKSFDNYGHEVEEICGGWRECEVGNFFKVYFCILSIFYAYSEMQMSV